LPIAIAIHNKNVNVTHFKRGPIILRLLIFTRTAETCCWNVSSLSNSDYTALINDSKEVTF
jgi:hypothetical protein